MAQQFKVGDIVECISSDGLPHLIDKGEFYVVEATNNGFLACVQINGAWFVESRFDFVMADDEPQPDRSGGDRVLEHIMADLEGYAEQPPVDERDEGYRDALTDILGEVFGLECVTRVEFLPIGGK
jgi:hypothetical protein